MLFSFFAATDAYVQMPRVHDVLPREPCWFPFTHATRVGEATQPGPSISFNVGISNPTSIISKTATYKELCQDYSIHMIAAAETAATIKAQKMFRAKVNQFYPHLTWGAPVADKWGLKSDGDYSIRGQASGVAFMSTCHIRHALQTVAPVWFNTGRILHTVVGYGDFHFQVVTLYAMTGTTAEAAQFNRDLFQEAWRACQFLPLPCIVLGDFNKWTLTEESAFHMSGFQELQSCYMSKYGCTMPPTCKDSTTPDTALLCPAMTRALQNIDVLPEPFFDSHKVVRMGFQINSAGHWRTQLVLPRSFLELPIDQSLVADKYEALPDLSESPSFADWGTKVERAVDAAYRHTQCSLHSVPWPQTVGLPKAYRGRCQPRKPIQRRFVGLATKQRGNDSSYEVHSYAAIHKIRQVRRLQSMCRNLSKPPTDALKEHVRGEWKAVLKCRAFGDFTAWATSFPEIQWLPLHDPPLTLVYDLYQLAKLEADQQVATDHQIWLRKLKYKTQIDHDTMGSAHAFRLLREKSQPPLQFEREVHQQCIAVPENDQFRAYVLDPLLMLILHAIRSAQRFLHRASEGTRAAFYERAALHDGSHQTCKGPAACLAYYLLKLGWTLTRQGLVHVTAFVSLPLLTTGPKQWTWWLRHCWSEECLPFHSQRSAWQGLSPPDPFSTQQVLSRFDPVAQRSLINEISGAFQTRAQQSVWDPQVTAECQHCSGTDTRVHRVFECTATSEVRATHRDLLDWVTDEIPIWSDLPVIFRHVDHDFIRMLHYRQPPPELTPDLQRQLAALDDGSRVLSFYTDGSCQFPGNVVTRFAAYSVVMDMATTDADRMTMASIFQMDGTIPGTFKVLARQKLRGYQTIPRAELEAIVVVCEWFLHTRIYSDCEAALTAVAECEAASDVTPLLQHEHADLLLRLWPCLQRGSRAFHKVKAHAMPDSGDLLATYHALGNQFADRAAQHACTALFPDMERVFVAHHRDTATMMDKLEQFFHYTLELQRVRTQLQAQAYQEPREEADTLPQTLADQLPTYEMGVSWMELCIAFAQRLGFWIPVNWDIGQGPRLHLFNVTDFDAHGISFGEVSRAFSNFVLQVLKLVDIQLLGPAERCNVRSIYLQGAMTFSHGMKPRPQFPGQHHVTPVLRRYLQSNRGPSFIAFPDLSLTPRPDFNLDQLQHELGESWHVQARQYKQGAARMKAWIDSRQQVLVFR
eukprot:Skav203789  [mRNA]  locus=scaffold206:504480:509752:+ [translate_table: standard]